MFRRLLTGLFLATLLVLPAAAQKPPALGQPAAPPPIAQPQAVPPPVAQPPAAQPGDKPLPGQPPAAQPPVAQPPVAQPPVAQPPQQPQRPGPRPVQPQQAERSFTLTNNAPRTIFELYVFPDGAAAPGPDRLGADVLPAGRNYTVRLGRVAGCVFTIRAIYDNRQTEEQRGVNLCQTQQVAFTGQGLPVEAGPERTAEIVNGADRTIMQVYVSPTTSQTWLEDRLGADVLPAGQTYRVNWRGECQVDVRIIYDNQGAEERRNIDLCQIARLNVRPGWVTAENLSAPGAAPGVAAPGFSLVNRSGQEILQVFVFPDGARARGRDRLGADVLPDGRTYQVRHEDRGAACAFTLRIVYSGNAPDEERPGIDLCRTNEIVIQQGWVTAPLPTGPAVVPPAGPRTGQVPASFTLINNSGTTVFTLFVFPDGGAQGPDRLGADTVANGARYTVNLQGVTNCSVTVRATFTGGRQPVQQSGINICASPELTIGAAGITAGGQAPSAPPAQPQAPGQVPASFTLVNNAGVTVFTLFVFPDGATAQGPDRLGVETVAAGARFTVPLQGIASCMVTIRATFQDNRPPVQQAGINICTSPVVTVASNAIAAGGQAPAAAPPPGPGQVPPTLGLLNNSGTTIFTLFVFADGAPAGQDRLGADVINNGARYAVPLSGITTCVVTVRVTFTGGRPAEERRGLNVCQTAEITVAPGWNAAGAPAPQAPQAQPQAPQPQAPGSVPANFQLVNNSGVTIFTLFVFADGTTVRGPDRLGADTIANGARYAVNLQGITGCMVTIRVTFTGSRPAEERSGVNICQTREVTVAPGWNVAGAPGAQPQAPAAQPPAAAPGNVPAQLTVINNAGATIFTLHVFAVGASEMGPDRLGADTIANGARYQAGLQGITNCLVVIRVSFTGNRPNEERHGFDVCRNAEVTVAPGWTQAGAPGQPAAPAPAPAVRPPPGIEQGFVLINNSGRAIFALYVFAEGAPGRGPDRLGVDTIANGARFTVPLPDRGTACRFTIRVVYAGGAPDEERAGVDLCTTREITVAPGWTQAWAPALRELRQAA